MTHYNRLSEVVYDERLRSWYFRVKILMIYPFYSYITNNGAHMIYVLADGDGAKMEMTIYSYYAEKFRGLEEKERECVEIFRVEVYCAYPRFKVTKNFVRTNCYGLYASPHYRSSEHSDLHDFKNIHEIPRISSSRDRDYSIDAVGVVFNTEAHFDVPAMPKMVFYIRDSM